MSQKHNHSRRGFLKTASLLAGGSLITPSLMAETLLTTKQPTSVDPSELVTWRVSGAHWGAFRAKVVGNRLVEVEPFEYDKHPTRILDSVPGIVYSPARVRYPLVRLDWYKNREHSDRSQRGDNRFIRVSWDEALDLLYDELERIQTTYGPWALHTGNVGWRSVGQVHSCGNHMLRAIAMHGNSVGTVGDYSTGAGQVILPYILGSTEVYSQGTSWDIILEESKVIVIWGNDLIKNLQVGWNTETHEAYAYLEQLKEKVANKEIRVICIDPVKNMTANYLECEHLYVNPMTDLALMLGMAHTLWKENLYDVDFLDTYTLGFDEFLPYIKGETEDKVEKTPEWAEKITGVPADTIRQLARDMASNRTQMMIGWSMQRQQHGEQPYWMSAIIAAMLGQIGLPGGGISYSHHYSSVGVSSSGASMPGSFPLNLDFGREPEHKSTDYKGYANFIPVSRVIDAIIEPGIKMNYNGNQINLAPYKMVVFSGCNQWHRQQDHNRMKRAYQNLETVMVVDYNWTATCRFADIVLPACTTYERNDLDIYGTYSNRGIIAMQKLIDPLYYSKTDFDIWAEFSKRLGREKEYTQGKDEMQWIEKLYMDCYNENHQKGFYMPSFREFWQKGSVLFPEGKPWVRHAAFREDPEVNALGTPSGFIEIYSRTIASYNYPDCKGHPIWMEKAERSHGGPKSEKFPLWMQSAHPDNRLHSQGCEATKMRETYAIAGREPVFISPEDAASRGIEHGDLVRVFNDRGQLLAGANVNSNFAPGVVRIFEGAWYSPLDQTVGSIDTYGDPNTLTIDVGTSMLSQATSANTCQVEIEKFIGEAPEPNGFTGPITVDIEGKAVPEV